ncbi:response regulator transcription factor [Arsenicibacter rosenii]|uniref:Two-component system response regulator n=1 Tax=Arsenicibacter rosenii TaxID=1750698 RepID=A0A1S2VNL5_9BACT|nr:response regulator transcription factor [Arsenicibacter rosenii]OIN60371.1 two-component system response regulator [Arsenicibacter rosenii]
MTTKSKILLVEDDLSMGFLLSEYLEENGFDVKLCRDGESGLSTFRRGHFDLCILDVMMPRMDGFMLAQALRSECASIPFLFLTARSLKDDKLKGFSLGADDYITKPFDEDELLCRINVLLRRQIPVAIPASPQRFTIGSYAFDYSRQELSWQHETWRLTETEAEVLRLLCLNQNQILRREDAVEAIYGKKDYFLGRSFDVFISKLRKLLQHDPTISIDNVFRVGFILNVSD